MMQTKFTRLEDVILDPLFPDLDLALRRGRHVDADALALYTFLVDARDHLEPFLGLEAQLRKYAQQTPADLWEVKFKFL